MKKAATKKRGAKAKTERRAKVLKRATVSTSLRDFPEVTHAEGWIPEAKSSQGAWNGDSLCGALPRSRQP